MKIFAKNVVSFLTAMMITMVLVACFVGSHADMNLEKAIRPHPDSSAVSQFGHLIALDEESVVIAGSNDVLVVGEDDMPVRLELSSITQVDSLDVSGPWVLVGDSSGVAEMWHCDEDGVCNLNELKRTGFHGFGASVAVHDEVAVIGASGSQAVMVYGYEEEGEDDQELDGWVREAILTPEEGSDDAEFGRSVAMNGKMIVVGGSGSASMYSGSSWKERVSLIPLLDEEDEGGDMSSFGAVVAVSEADEGLIAVAAPSFGQGGAVFLFNGLGEVGRLEPVELDEGAEFGGSVSISDGVIAVGASKQGKCGAVYLFARIPRTGKWEEVGSVQCSASTMLGGTVFGSSVGLSEDHLVIGSPGDGFWMEGQVFDFDLDADCDGVCGSGGRIQSYPSLEARVAAFQLVLCTLVFAAWYNCWTKRTGKGGRGSKRTRSSDDFEAAYSVL